MKRLALIFSAIFLVISCNSEKKKEGSTNNSDGAFAQSAGRMNTLTVVMDNMLWEGKVGDVLRDHLAAPVAGLPQEEPLFTIRQMSHSAFAGFARKSRGFIRITENKPKAYQVHKNKYARPQMGIDISGQNNAEVIAAINENSDQIVAGLKALELQRKQSLIKKTLPVTDLDENLGIEIKIPTAYRVAEASKDFYWIRKNIPHGSMDLLIYEVPATFFKESMSITQNIIRMRDSISGSRVVVDEGGKFITEEAFSPYLKNTQIKGKPSFETRGTWEVKNKYMAGPFINYTIQDKNKDRFLVLEGFVFAPSVRKRDYLFELEAIIKTLEFVE